MWVSACFPGKVRAAGEGAEPAPHLSAPRLCESGPPPISGVLRNSTHASPALTLPPAPGLPTAKTDELVSRVSGHAKHPEHHRKSLATPGARKPSAERERTRPRAERRRRRIRCWSSLPAVCKEPLPKWLRRQLQIPLKPVQKWKIPAKYENLRSKEQMITRKNISEIKNELEGPVGGKRWISGEARGMCPT